MGNIGWKMNLLILESIYNKLESYMKICLSIVMGKGKLFYDGKIKKIHRMHLNHVTKYI